jgi:hypothetical protein
MTLSISMGFAVAGASSGVGVVYIRTSVYGVVMVVVVRSIRQGPIRWLSGTPWLTRNTGVTYAEWLI